MNSAASGLLLSVVSGIAVAACGGPTGPNEPPAFDGRYEGSWQFTLRDSVLLDSRFGCGFAVGCTSPQRRPYVTISCVAALEMQMTGATVYPWLNTPALGLIGELTLEQCTERYAAQSRDFVGLPPLLPPGLVTVAARTSLVGWAQWERAEGGRDARWSVALALRNTTGSFGELIGCSPESNPPAWHFGAVLQPEADIFVAQGGIAGTLVEGPSFHCTEYIMFLGSSFHLQRGLTSA